MNQSYDTIFHDLNDEAATHYISLFEQYYPRGTLGISPPKAQIWNLENILPFSSLYALFSSEIAILFDFFEPKTYEEDFLAHILE